jgi:hypothetical protein
MAGPGSSEGIGGGSAGVVWLRGATSRVYGLGSAGISWAAIANGVGALAGSAEGVYGFGGATGRRANRPIQAGHPSASAVARGAVRWAIEEADE